MPGPQEAEKAERFLLGSLMQLFQGLLPMLSPACQLQVLLWVFLSGPLCCFHLWALSVLAWLQAYWTETPKPTAKAGQASLQTLSTMPGHTRLSHECRRHPPDPGSARAKPHLQSLTCLCWTPIPQCSMTVLPSAVPCHPMASLPQLVWWPETWVSRVLKEGSEI